MPESVPTFVVVGHVNKGKSSVVATLAEDRSIPIDWTPGTTDHADAYELRVDGEPAFRLVDTPGFQEAAAALAWMQARASGPADRRAAVEAFVREHESGERFRDEVELLKPLLDDAGVLYVVDAARPYRDAHEPEMEILRWTGRPGIALLNRIGEEDHADDWRPVLQQYFSAVRSFDAVHATFEDRMDLLRAFAAVREDWARPLLAAVERLEQERRERDASAARAIATFLAEALSHVERKRVGGDAAFRDADAGAPAAEAADAALNEAFRKSLRRLERRARARVEKIYRHSGVQREEADLDVAGRDLFDEVNLRVLGLTSRQLALRGAGAGAVAGGGLDLLVGGLSFGVGAALGAATGAAGAWLGGRRLATHWTPNAELLAQLLPGETGRFRCLGPIESPRFRWVLLDRALLHWDAIRARAHADPDALRLRTDEGDVGPADGGGDAPRGIATRLPAHEQKRLADLFARFAACGREARPVPADAVEELTEVLRGVVR